MQPDSLFRIELIEDLRHRRSLLFKLALPIILALPLTMSILPDSLRQAGLPLIALFLGVLGSSVGLTRMKERGLIERLSVLPLPRTGMIMGYLFANAAMDGVQMIVPSFLVIASLGPGPQAVGLAGAGIALSILAANALGVLVSAAAGGSGEVHLFSGLCVVGIAGASGLFSEASRTFASDYLPFGFTAETLSKAPSDLWIPLVVSLGITLLLVAGATTGAARMFRSK